MAAQSLLSNKKGRTPEASGPQFVRFAVDRYFVT